MAFGFKPTEKCQVPKFTYAIKPQNTETYLNREKKNSGS